MMVACATCYPTQLTQPLKCNNKIFKLGSFSLLQANKANANANNNNANANNANNNNILMFRRVDKNRILHFEFYNKSWYLPLIMRIPLLLRPKPLLKGGMRTFTTTSNEMDLVIQETFKDIADSSDSTTTKNVALMVYMWVSPRLRGLNYGDILLSNIITEARSKLKAEFLLIVHDDNGSGKLIKYYQDRGFVPIFRKIDKGMLLRL